MALRFQLVAEAGPPGRIPVIDELKGFAMLLVILYHAGGVLNWPNYLHGETGVDIFLVISGFTLTRSAAELPVRKFFVRRLLRIFPAYWLALALFVFLGRKYFGSPITLGNLVTHIFGLQGFDLVHKEYFSAINDSFWFISLILMLYAVFIAIRRRLDDLSFVVGFGMLLTALVSAIYLRAEHDGGLIQFAVRIPSFFLGVVAGQLARPRVSELRLSGWLVFGALALAYVGFLRGVIPYYTFGAPALMLGYLLMRRSFARHPDGRFALRCVEWVGVYSYEIFLLHQPLIRDYNRLYWARILGTVEISNLQLVEGMAVALIATGALAFATHRLIDLIFSSRTRPVAPALAHAH